MGVQYSYMNVWALSSIMRITDSDVDRVYELFEADQVDFDSRPPQTGVTYHTVTEDKLVSYLQSFQALQADIDVFVNLFRLIDTRGFNAIDIRDVLICVTVLTSKDVQECIERSILVIDRQKTGLLDKAQLYQVLRLLNDTCYYFGDKCLTPEQLHDLVDSTYATAGKLDGYIFYSNFIEYIAHHPIMELFLSPQHQGNTKSKILSDEELEAYVYADR